MFITVMDPYIPTVNIQNRTGNIPGLNVRLAKGDALLFCYYLYTNNDYDN